MKKFLLIAFLVVIFDQVTKFLLEDVHYGIFNYTTNTGAAFSLFQGYTVILSIISALVIVFILFVYKKYSRYYLSLGLILGGTIGNLIDRIMFGYVRDFVDFGFWPVFNIADAANTIGVIILVWFLVKESFK
ncbi:MAG: signal peptidase II [Candidatus Woesearchaeota archaeon]